MTEAAKTNEEPAEKDKSKHDKLKGSLKTTLIRLVLMHAPEIVTDTNLMQAEAYEVQDGLERDIKSMRETLKDYAKNTGQDVKEETLIALDAVEDDFSSALDAIDKQLELFAAKDRQGNLQAVDGVKKRD